MKDHGAGDDKIHLARRRKSIIVFLLLLSIALLLSVLWGTPWLTDRLRVDDEKDSVQRFGTSPLEGERTESATGLEVERDEGGADLTGTPTLELNEILTETPISILSSTSTTTITVSVTLTEKSGITATTTATTSLETPGATHTSSPTSSPSITVTPSSTPTHTKTLTPTNTPSPTTTPTPSSTRTPTLPPSPTPADSSAPFFQGFGFLVLIASDGDSCQIKIDKIHARDLPISFGIGPDGVGNQAGFVKLSCTHSGSGDLCNINLTAMNISYAPYEEWNADYSGSTTISGVSPTTALTVKVTARDNSGKMAEESIVRTGCK